MKPKSSVLRHTLAAFVVTLSAFSSSAQALILLNDDIRPREDVDNRPGQLLPTAAQLATVKALGANATWNRFGTPATMIRQGDYLATGLQGTPEQAARNFIKANHALFKLAASSVDSLELVNQGITPNNPGHALLFRQHFSGLAATHDGLIMVGVVNGKVYYVTSSSAGDQPPAGAATLTPLQAWLKAAADINQNIPSSAIRSVVDQTETQGWHLITVTGFAQPQRARLVAIPIPAGGVRQAYETVFVDVKAGYPQAYVHFVDAQTGEILRREDRVNWQSSSTPGVTPFQGAYPDDKTCGDKQEFTVAAGQSQITVNMTMLAGAVFNEADLHLFFKDPVNGSVVLAGSPTLGLTPTAIAYSPSGGIPAGTYQVQVCPTGTDVTTTPPYAYVGSFITTPVGAAAATNLPSWKWFPYSPDIHYTDADQRQTACTSSGTGCDFIAGTRSSPYPWDVLPATATATLTTIGNNAITAEAWGSPLTPAEQYRPVSPSRSYIFPFSNAWYKSKCNPTNLTPTGNDIDAAVTQLFVVHNRMHDWAYQLGFTEQNYNGQVSNFGLTSAKQEHDQELGNAQAGALSAGPDSPNFYAAPGRDNANQITEQDGVAGITNQYLFQSLGGSLYVPCADGDFDMSIVGHEYTHFVSGRMVGGPDDGLNSDQGGAMNESFSDLGALEYINENGYTLPGVNPTSVGGYTLTDFDRGIRNYPLNDTPLNFSNYGYDTGGVEVHSDGEIWNAIQWTVRQALVDKYQSSFPYEDQQRQSDCALGTYPADSCPGNRRWIQLIYDAYLLMQGSVTIPEARDAMLAADMARFGGKNQKELWHAYAQRGLGKNAYTSAAADTTPIPSFESPLEPNAEVSFAVTAIDESSAPISAQIFIGQFIARSRPIADTDPATKVDATSDDTRLKTLNLQDHTSIVPGTYDFIVSAPGYGMHRFPGIHLDAGARTLSFALPTNWASMKRGATVTTTATKQENIDAKDRLIDESEDTSVRFGDAAPIAGAYAIVKLAGGAHLISRANISTASGPTPVYIEAVEDTPASNGGRFTGVRQFEIRVCNGACTDAVKDFNTIAYTSPDDLFPGRPPRPAQNDLNLRSVEFAPVMATHVMLKALTNQCTGQPLFAGDTDADPGYSADCPSFQPPPYAGVGTGVIDGSLPLVLVAPASVVRATEFEVFGSKATGSGSTTTTPTTPGTGSIGTPTGSVSSGSEGRFGGGSLGLGLLLPLLFGTRRRRFTR